MAQFGTLERRTNSRAHHRRPHFVDATSPPPAQPPPPKATRIVFFFFSRPNSDHPQSQHLLFISSYGTSISHDNDEDDDTETSVVVGDQVGFIVLVAVDFDCFAGEQCIGFAVVSSRWWGRKRQRTIEASSSSRRILRRSRNEISIGYWGTKTKR